MNHKKNFSYLENEKRRIIPIGSDAVLVDTVHRFSLVIPTWNVDVGVGIVRDGLIEPWTNDVFVNLINEGGRVVNVGANFGYYSVLGAQTVGRSGRVYSIEANPVVYTYLLRTLFWSGYPDVIRAYNCAAVSPEMHGKKLTFFFDPQFIGGGNLFGAGAELNKMAECIWSADNIHRNLDENRMFVPAGLYSSVQTEGRTVDSLVKEPIDAMLIDAEGSESYVIAGAMNTIRQSPNISIIMEWDPRSYASLDRKPYIDRMFDFLFDEQKMVFDRICHEGYRGLGTYPNLTPLNRQTVFDVPHSDILIRRKRD